MTPATWPLAARTKRASFPIRSFDAYADEHIAHYTRRELIELFEGRGFRLEDTRYIHRGELILAFRKPS